MNRSTPSVETILAQAVEIASAAERQAFVEQACAGDAELKRRVERLIGNHFQAGSFLERPAVAMDPDGTAGWEPAGAADGPGTVIGPYKLLEQIGEGGMGLVFVADQQQPIKRRVALKIIKPGMDSRQVIARFEAERQALAMMDHPHIAKVHDGGATPEGRPFFVMELVKGIPITDYCDEHRLTTRQRLALFIDVCHAVQHAHQKGVIHRDLKPSNVLVSVHDVTPVVKVIDFGVAKAIGGRLTDKTVYTAFAQMVGTPLYMSPEQAGLSDLDVDTRSDVYSLGVLLYELLTGTTPCDSETLETAGYDEMRRIIREDEPPRPSTRLSALEKAKLSTICERRGTDPRKLNHEVRGELDWIVMKALEKDRDRRYESASALAADVQRYLNDEPVQACPPSTLYRLRKFVRRHKAGLGVAAMLLMAVLVGGISWVWWAHKRAEAERWAEEALVEAGKALARGNPYDPDLIAAVRKAESQLGSGMIREELQQRVNRTLADLAMLAKLERIRLDQASVVDNHFDIAGSDQAYAEAFREYGIDVELLAVQEAGDQIRKRAIGSHLAAALDQWAVARQERERLGRSHGNQPPNESSTWRRLFEVAQVASPDPWRGSLQEALAANKTGSADLEKLVASARLGELPAPILARLGTVLARAGAAPLAVDVLRLGQQRYPADFWIHLHLAEILAEEMKPPQLTEALGCYRAALALRPSSPGVHYDLGNALRKMGQIDNAIACYREAIRLKKDYVEAHNNLGRLLADKGRLDEAIGEYRAAIRIKKDYPVARNNLGQALMDKGQPNEAFAEYRAVIRTDPNFASAHHDFGVALASVGRLPEAIAEYREGIRLNNDPEVHYHLAHALDRMGQRDKAIASYREAIRLKKDYVEAHNNLGVTLMDSGRLDEAIVAYRQAIKIKPDHAKAHRNLSATLLRKGQLDKAEAEAFEAIRLDKDYANAHYVLGDVLRAKGQLDAAIAAYREAIRLKADHAEAHCNLGHSLCDKGQFAQALEYLRRGHQLGSKGPHWRYPSAQWVQDCERLAELDARLPAVVNGQQRPADNAERLEFAQLCQLPCKKQFAVATRLYGEAFAAKPALADDLSAANRYNAACASALAGCGQGKDAASLDEKGRGRLRRQALDWLGADLLAWRRFLEKEPVKAYPVIGEQLQHWLRDPDLSGVRGAEALVKLPQAERQSWQQLWADVADTLKRGQGKAVPENKPKAK